MMSLLLSVKGRWLLKLPSSDPLPPYFATFYLSVVSHSTTWLASQNIYLQTNNWLSRQQSMVVTIWQLVLACRKGGLFSAWSKPDVHAIKNVSGTTVTKWCHWCLQRGQGWPGLASAQEWRACCQPEDGQWNHASCLIGARQTCLQGSSWPLH